MTSPSLPSRTHFMTLSSLTKANLLVCNASFFNRFLGTDLHSLAFHLAYDDLAFYDELNLRIRPVVVPVDVLSYSSSTSLHECGIWSIAGVGSYCWCVVWVIAYSEYCRPMILEILITFVSIALSSDASSYACCLCTCIFILNLCAMNIWFQQKKPPRVPFKTNV